MCGITGWVSYTDDLTRRRSELTAMNATMSCRGPDAHGEHVSRHAALAHSRLAIIDLEGGRQPMSVSVGGKDVVITYSGEVYNYRELRDSLMARGHTFETRSDTEVVLRAYVEWGEAFVETLNGMFAFAIWDDRDERMLLVRDRAGVKPLFYYPADGGVLFGSEPKAILAHPDVTPRVDADGLREMFQFTRTPGQAVWRGMREMRPGTVVTVSRAGIRERVYWRLEAREHTDDLATTVTHVRDLLQDIATRQMVSDVPRCVLLSGGLDSSALTALAARGLRQEGDNERVRSFAVDFRESADTFRATDLRETQDAPYIREVVAHVGTEHRDIVLDSRTMADPWVRRATVGARDLPGPHGDMDLSLYLLFRAVREQSTVALSGEAADELFGGYLWFHHPAAREAETFPWTAIFGDAEQEALKLLRPEVRAKLRLTEYARDRYAEAVAEVPVLPGEEGLEARMRRIGHLNLTRWMPSLLERKDRMSMATGLEVRVPFCDHRLTEYVFNTPWSFKTFDGREKGLLRAAVQDLLPASVADRKKSPYPSTQDPFYQQALQQQAKQVAADRDSTLFGLVSEDWLAAAVAVDPTAMNVSVRHGLERVLELAAWIERYDPVVSLD
ncbi:asparagine synthase (glutamine-hydrolyzing) [Streptomyces sp. CS149]|uniref:asparagine synthase (glutamine-hydrolyzing) n=1 Tax=Streptomyces sp. CS149 TaxID=2109332 RepID=UPI000D19BD17|nr:asparagine synthase (glutamine-hydrolyzing) [Streptomyces sp. CS149]MCC8476975.1 asparagine synthase (glutamine-hydrolyzing) [Streptomyces globisporus]PSK71846.1 asparagine synthase (glutamine-hydrolyzing) [Streptomyces sp. CS149]